VSRPEEHIYEPIAVQDGGSFRIVNFHELIIAQSDLLQATMKKTEEQRLLLEEKNREILDSIYYAERIQKAMLRSHLQFDHPQVGVFFLFRPRDIVSGDFFWTAQRDGKIYIAAVDCTGHGVPGAFMSLIGHNLLDSIVLSKGITEANLVLNLLHENVRRSLNQSNDNLTDRDGMDICLCVIDLERRHLDFSGAKRSLFLTNAQGELFVGKGDRFSIGGFQREESRVYAVSRVYLEPGQTFYLTTDGYADQPSVTNEKFGSQRLRLLFKDIYALPFADKQRFIEAALDQHQGEQPQRDDITIIGVEWRGTDTNLDNPDNQTNSL
jgi:serine phosphatase RsbU (regulator of sigma subunit)